ncbi:MAG: hypothetical protein ACYC8T_36760 [Myxococcaceae bacterium]
MAIDVDGVSAEAARSAWNAFAAPFRHCWAHFQWVKQHPVAAGEVTTTLTVVEDRVTESATDDRVLGRNPNQVFMQFASDWCTRPFHTFGIQGEGRVTFKYRVTNLRPGESPLTGPAPQ